MEIGDQDSGLYLTHLERNPPGDVEAGALAQELTVGEMYFFRYRDQFHAFTDEVLPARMRARASDRCLRLLSAGCASGEEAYSLAILLKERHVDPAWDISIRAVDINPAALARAAAGRYSSWALRETPPEVQGVI